MAEGGGEPRASPKRWGAEYIRAGEARFRIWAQALDRLTLRLDGRDAPMARDGTGCRLRRARRTMTEHWPTQSRFGPCRNA